MAQDLRSSRTVMSGFSHITSEEEDPQSVVDVRVEETMTVDYIHIQVSSHETSSVDSPSEEEQEFVLQLYDEEGYDTSDELEKEFDVFILNPGDEVKITGATYDDVQNGLVAFTGGDNLSDLKVTVGGVKVTQ